MTYDESTFCPKHGASLLVVHYRLAPDDLREALNARFPGSGVSKSNYSRKGWGLLVLLTLLLVAIVVADSIRRGAALLPMFRMAARPALDWVPLIATIILFVTFRKFARRGLMATRNYLRLFAVVTGLLALSIGTLRADGSAQSVISPGAISGWFVLVFFWWTLYVNTSSRANSLAWQDQTQLHLPKTLAIFEHGLCIRDNDSCLQYRWKAFSGFVETPNVCVLNIGERLFHMIPKRALVNSSGLEILRSNLSPNSSLLRAFPVVPTHEGTPRMH